MQRTFCLIILVAMLLAPLPGRAANTGDIEGVVLHGVTEKPMENVLVTLTTGTADDAPATETTTTDADGRYEFRDLPAGEDRYYALDARYEGGVFSGGAISIPDDTEEKPVFDTTLRVWDTITDPDAIVINRHSVFLVQNDRGSISVIESVTITNISDDAYIGRAPVADRSAEEDVPSLGFALPGKAIGKEVSVVDSDLNLPQLLRTEYGFAATTAIPPGEHAVTFSYPLEGVAASYDISRRMLYPTLRFSIYAADPLTVTSNRLEQDDDAEVGGRSYRHYTTEDTLEAADSVQAVALADAGLPAGLMAGMAGALALVIALGAYPFLRRRKKAAEPDAPQEPAVDRRDELLKEIAALDIAHEQGDIERAEWSARRAELKNEIVELSAATKPRRS